jgi:hypothetical protein
LINANDLDNSENLVRANVIKEFEKIRNMIKTSIVKSVGQNFSRFYEISVEVNEDKHFYSILIERQKRKIGLKM